MKSIIGDRYAESERRSNTLAGWTARKRQLNIVRINGLYRWP